MKPLFRLLGCAIVAAAVPLSAIAEPGQDELWETTMAMESEGMKMPAMTQTNCTPKGAREEQRMMDKNCRVLESKQSGKKHIFKFACEDGADKWTGTGEMESLGKDAWRGTMSAAGTREGQKFSMKMDMSAKRKGNCTYEDPRKKVDAMVAQQNAMLAKECDKMIAELQPAMFFGAQGLPEDALFCKDRKTDFCANVTKVTSTMRDPKGFREGQSKYDTRWRDAAQACGIDPASISGPVCKSAIDGKDWNFVASSCPAEAAALRKENCAGRTYTSVAANFREMCSTLGGLSYTADRADAAKAAPSGGETAPAEPKKKGATEMLKEGAGKLKKFLKF